MLAAVTPRIAVPCGTERIGRSLPSCTRLLDASTTYVLHVGGNLVNFLNVVQEAHVSFLDQGAFDTLALPSVRGSRRLAGVDLNKPRMRFVAAAVVALSPKPNGFTVGDLALKVQEMAGWKSQQYGVRQAAYDLGKIRGKDLARRVAKSRRYVARPEAVRRLCAYTVLREKVLKPIMAAASACRIGRPPKNVHPWMLIIRTCIASSKELFERSVWLPNDGYLATNMLVRMEP